MENYEKCWLHHCLDKTEEIVNHLDTNCAGETCCNDIGERSKCKTVIKLITREEKSLMSSSSKVCTKWLQGESDDQIIQPDNKLELGTSYKVKFGPR